MPGENTLKWFRVEDSISSLSTYNPGQKDLQQLIFFVALYARFQLLTKCKSPTVSQVINSPIPSSTMLI